MRLHFPEDNERISAYENLGERIPVELHTHQTIFIRCWGLEQSDAGRLCNDFTLEGKIPEPLRVARLCARQVSSINHGEMSVPSLKSGFLGENLHKNSRRI
ncbi:MAG: DUF99 family protein [Methanoregula sp.]